MNSGTQTTAAGLARAADQGQPLWFFNAATSNKAGSDHSHGRASIANHRAAAGSAPSLANPLSFRAIAKIPFDEYMATLDSAQLTGHDSELRLGTSLLQGPIQRYHSLGTWQVQVRLGRGPLRPPARMRLDIAPWPPAATALETHPVSAGTAQRSLLRGRPPPAGLLDPSSTGAHAGAATSRSPLICAHSYGRSRRSWPSGTAVSSSRFTAIT